MLSYPEVEEDNIENASPKVNIRKEKNINTFILINNTKKGNLSKKNILHIIMNLLLDYLISILNCRKVYSSIIMQHIGYSRN